MNILKLIIFLSALTPTISVASNDIAGFFGVKLGEAFEGKYETLIRGGNSEPMTEYKVKVPSSYPIKYFHFYKVLLQTKTKKVSSINAKLAVSDWSECRKQKAMIYDYMVQIFGTPPKKPENQYYTFRSDDNTRMAEIQCASSTAGGPPDLELTVVDHTLIKEIEREYAERTRR